MIKITKNKTTKLSTLFAEMTIAHKEENFAREHRAPYMGSRSPPSIRVTVNKSIK